MSVYGAVAAAGSTVGGGTISGLTGLVLETWVAPYFAPTQLDHRYLAFYFHPNVLPPAGDLLRMLSNPRVNAVIPEHLLRCHGIYPAVSGITLPIRNGQLALGTAWREIARFAGAIPGPETALRMLYSGTQWGRQDIAEAGRQLTQHYGMWDFSLQQQAMYPWHEPWVGASSLILTPQQAADLYWRGIISWSDWEAYLARALVTRDGANVYAPLLSSMWLPGPSDLIRFLVRDVFNDDIVRKYGYDEEYPHNYARTFQLLGPGYPIRAINQVMQAAGFGGMRDIEVPADLTWAHLYWRAHWQLPSPTQVYEMIRRLRPHGAARLAQQLGVPAEDLVTTLDDARNVLKADDYPRWWRDRLIAISYRPLGRIDIARIQIEGVPDPVPPEERYQDLGYSEQDARVLAELGRRRSAAQRANRAGWPTVAEVSRWYSAGTITAEELRQLLAQRAVDNQQLAQWVTAAETRARIYERQLALTDIRTAYMRGHLDREEAAADVAVVLGDDLATDRLIRRWDRARMTRARQDTASGIVWDWQRGIIRTSDAIRELEGIGYPRATARRLLLRGRVKETERRLKALVARLRQLEAMEAKIIAQRERAQRKAEQLAKRANISIKEAQEQLKKQAEEARKQAEEEARRREEEAAGGLPPEAEIHSDQDTGSDSNQGGNSNGRFSFE